MGELSIVSNLSTDALAVVSLSVALLELSLIIISLGRGGRSVEGGRVRGGAGGDAKERRKGLLVALGGEDGDRSGRGA